MTSSDQAEPSRPPRVLLTTPAAEVEIDDVLIRSLLAGQHPDLAELPLEIMEAGWDNVMVRLGDELALRMPRRAVAEPLLLTEQKWLPRIAERLPLPIPNVLRVGVPTEAYPFHWSVLAWIPGSAADLAPPDSTEAPVLARFLKALHTLPVPSDGPRNSSRDGHLESKRALVDNCIAALSIHKGLVTPHVLDAWKEALMAPVTTSRRLIAGDVHARNVLTRNGAIAALIDWGDMCIGDPAVDLASAWALFEDAEARRAMFEAYGADAATVARARGWAVYYGAMLSETGLKDTPRHAAMGAATLRRVDGDG